MHKLTYLGLFLIGLLLITGCKNEVTYADQKKRERAAINKYLEDSLVTVISETDFATRNYTTNLKKNEFVLFNNGVYMQVIREGSGEKIKDGETATVICRFTERNIMKDSIQLSNVLSPSLAKYVDKFSVTKKSGTFTASFLSGLMLMAYSSTSVPEGWLMPLNYVRIGRPSAEGIAKVRLIVPHNVGHTFATRGVYPCLYDITYERGR